MADGSNCTGGKTTSKVRNPLPQLPSSHKVGPYEHPPQAKTTERKVHTAQKLAVGVRGRSDVICPGHHCAQIWLCRQSREGTVRLPQRARFHAKSQSQPPTAAGTLGVQLYDCAGVGTGQQVSQLVHCACVVMLLAVDGWGVSEWDTAIWRHFLHILLPGTSWGTPSVEERGGLPGGQRRGGGEGSLRPDG